MKNLLTFLCFTAIIATSTSISAQNTSDSESPIYDYENLELTSTATIPDFSSQKNKLKLTGTIYQNDGVTPAKDVILFIYQADENGDYQVKTENNKRSVRHRAWVRTDENGKYTFFTFVPGAAFDPITYPRRRGLKEIVPIVKESNKAEYNLNSFVFDDDPNMTKSCRKRLERKGIDTILKLKKENDIYVATKDIILEKDSNATK